VTITGSWKIRRFWQICLLREKLWWYFQTAWITMTRRLIVIHAAWQLKITDLESILYKSGEMICLKYLPPQNQCLAPLLLMAIKKHCRKWSICSYKANGLFPTMILIQFKNGFFLLSLLSFCSSGFFSLSNQDGPF